MINQTFLVLVGHPVYDISGTCHLYLGRILSRNQIFIQPFYDSIIDLWPSFCRKRFNKQLQDLTFDFELETKAREDLQRHRSRMENLISQLEAQIEMLSSVRILVFDNHVPGDFITKVKQVNSQSDLISMSIFAGPPYLTIRSSVCIILI